MPVYILLTKKRLNAQQKAQLTAAITQEHCRITAAPSHYVTVMYFSGYQLKQGRKAMLLATIRSGGTRTDEVVQTLGLELQKSLCHGLGITAQQCGVDFLGVQSHWIYEGQQVLPEPGQE